ncbi:hypothetical protein HanIR_Chr12g0567041 [Helianthus annuus]|nr:hypothetical protein HanIR_Chr12g0567041 [Helianthus annuus]KAJ0673814.1 hypothetical protein HanLR1_Chr12g0433151 [Helianthus annuus]
MVINSATDGVLKSTVEIISQGTAVVLEPFDADDSVNSESVRSSRVYNRFESQMNAIQTDVRTYCDDPEDLDEYNKWKLDFVLSDMEGEIEKLIGSSGSCQDLQADEDLEWDKIGDIGKDDEKDVQ